MGNNSNEGCCRVTRCVDVKAMKLDEKNIARLLPRRITESPGEPGAISMSDLSMSCLVDDKKLIWKIMGIKSNEGPISISDLSMTCQVDDKKLVRKIMGNNSNEGCCRVTRCVDVKAMKLDEKNIARLLPRRITEVKFFPT
ncbi:hypothetical protein L1987_06551 [Smallanthus sonchifolius]|uniref:Uncharacterized protein n=1 Tax=Smallanthus sonchifolius TaxID=185202 RepID=A0ACB9JYE9_9ASTR|nr:hypothetical protein L1987_06551 [Smallanthus sonchifolius]